MGLDKEDRQVLDALEDAGKLYDRYLDISRVTDITPDEEEREPDLPPPNSNEFPFIKKPLGFAINRTEGVVNGYMGYSS